MSIGYDPSVKVYYTKQTGSPGPSNRITPAPTISISPEIYYANDNPIGYTYNISLRGYAAAVRKDINQNTYGLEYVLDHMGDIREIFSFNGGNLYIQNSNNDTIVAKGATIKSLSFEPSDNKWVNYAQYSAELEFNEVDFIGCSSGALTIECNDSIFHQVADAKNICDNLVNLTEYKIKEFSDKWTIATDDRVYHNYGSLLTNNVFEVTYNISATGKNYYINDELIPAYQQAKLFVQKKLYDQVNSLINGALQIENNNMNSCNATRDITSIHNTGASGGIFSALDTWKNGSNVYDIYNETITCDCSESDGSFSLNYKAILKKSILGQAPNVNAALHTFTKDVSTDNLSTASISVKGTIQGLVRGGFIYYNNNFALPDTGSFITSIDAVETKYSNAKDHYFGLVGNNADLFDSFKDSLNITKGQLLIGGSEANDYPKSSSFVLDHNYTEGTLSYTASYDRSQTIARDRGYLNISIVRNDPVEIFQEFVVPGRSNGPIIQKLNMKTPTTISISIDGANQDNKTCSNINDLCSYMPAMNINGLESLLQDSPDLIKTREEYTSNPIDGSFSISLEYTSKS